MSVTAPGITCNTPAAATTTTLVAAGSTVGFKLDNTLYHEGPAALYRECINTCLPRYRTNPGAQLVRFPSARLRPPGMAQAQTGSKCVVIFTRLSLW